MTYRLLILILAACGPAVNTETSDDASHTTTEITTGTPTTGTPTADGCPDHAAVDDCCCFGGLVGEPYVEVLCPAEQLCSNVHGECLGDFTGCTSADESAIDCVLAALQADKPGVVSWDLRWVGADQPELDVSVYVSGHGDLFWLGIEETGDPSYFYGVQHYPVAALDLPACAAEPTASARFECLRGAFVSPSELCVEPQYSG